MLSPTPFSTSHFTPPSQQPPLPSKTSTTMNVSQISTPTSALAGDTSKRQSYQAPHVSLTMCSSPASSVASSPEAQNENYLSTNTTLTQNSTINQTNPLKSSNTFNINSANVATNPSSIARVPTKQPIMERPGMVRFYSTPTLPCMSPTRQQFRLPNLTPRHIKETLNASLRVDETGRKLNQYQIKEEIGQGSFGTVWKVVDENNEFYAMKEYSKSSLRKHLRTQLLSERRAALRKRDTRPAARGHPQGDLRNGNDKNGENALSLIRREFAIAKKLDHPNIVTLVEVLDDPHGDSLYLILEWCEKGPIMPSSNDSNSLQSCPDNVEPKFTEEQCRLYFRDMILGIEYLHSQGVIHRDIKADNLLLDDDDVLKIADFGVSELFEQDNDIITKTAGSPAYMAPELAIISNATLMDLAATKDIPINSLSGRCTDIWAMGVTLYYMVFGYLPFRADNLVDLFTKIVTEEVEIPPGTNPDLVDLFSKILCKSPQKRIKMDELRQHPWVTHRGEDLLLSKEENIAVNIEPVTEEDIQSAIERIKSLGVAEPEQAFAKLRRLHGWRGQSTSSSNCSSRSPSMSPYMGPKEVIGRTPSPIEGISVNKLTRALEEVVQRTNNRTRQKKHESACSQPTNLYYSTTNSSSSSIESPKPSNLSPYSIDSISTNGPEPFAFKQDHLNTGINEEIIQPKPTRVSDMLFPRNLNNNRNEGVSEQKNGIYNSRVAEESENQLSCASTSSLALTPTDTLLDQNHNNISSAAQSIHLPVGAMNVETTLSPLTNINSNSMANTVQQNENFNSSPKTESKNGAFETIDGVDPQIKHSTWSTITLKPNENNENNSTNNDTCILKRNDSSKVKFELRRSDFSTSTLTEGF